MLDYEVIIIGGGPAGLSAGIYLCRGKRRTLLIDREGFGGQLKNIAWIENYPGFARGVSGAQLASEMVNQATGCGLELELAEVTGIELYSASRCVQLNDGRIYTAEAVIVATGCQRKKLGVPGEAELEGKGIIGCALCEGDQFADKVVAVCGGGDTGVTEALYLSRIASRVILLEAQPELTAATILRERAAADRKIEIRRGVKVTAISGQGHVQSISLKDAASRQKSELPVDGVLVAIGMEPNTVLLENIVQLDTRRCVSVNSNMETSARYILAAGDIRSGSPNQIATAVSDGAIAAMYVQKMLQQES